MRKVHVTPSHSPDFSSGLSNQIEVKWFQFVSSGRSCGTAAHCVSRGEEEEEKEEGYLDNVSNREEVRSRENIIFVLLIFTLALDNVETSRKSFRSILLSNRLSTE